MEPGGITREWLEALDPAEFRAISSMISDIQREREDARRRKREERRGTRPARRLELRTVPVTDRAGVCIRPSFFLVQ